MSPVINNHLDPEIKQNVDRWLNENYDPATKEQIRKLLIDNPQEIVDAFYTTLTFGTGGLRGIMGVGSNRINVYTVRRATQGLADYINSQERPPHGYIVLIGYDSRHNSRAFAEETAKVLAGNKIKVLLFKDIRPTPLVSYGCRYKKCIAAIMITASHNPPQYNGYKVYWTDGGQVLPPHDKNIIQLADQITSLEMVKLAPSISHPLIEEIDTEVDQAYSNSISRLQNYQDDSSIHGGELKVVYTSLHGTGMTMMPQTLARWGFKDVHYVDKQTIPDGDFPTVHSPNPEDPKALALGIQEMQNIGGDLLIATDPDADRVGVAIRHGSKIEILTGNQIAALLLNHICEALTAKNKLAANGAFIKTIVTTELFQAIADYYQKPCFNVLPGFKYIAEKIHLWESETRGHQFIFGGEDSNGYLYGTLTRDKDAIAASVLICEMALQAKLKGKTLLDQLHSLYHLYGIFYEKQSIIQCQESKEGRDKIAKSMQLLRRSPPKAIAGINVNSFEDFEQSLKIDFKTHLHEPLQQPKSNLLLFWMDDGSKLTIRPSGTEPKIKIYCSVIDKHFQSIDAALKNCEIRSDAFITALKARLEEEI